MRLYAKQPMAMGFHFHSHQAISVPAVYLCRKPSIGAKIMPTNEKANFSTLCKVQKQV